MKKYLPFILICGVLLVGLFFYFKRPVETDPKIDGLAQCLADKNAVMYGAYWCSHCKDQKKMFGASFEKIKYVECTQETQTCLEKDIKGYPTWIFESGERLSGVQSFEELSKASGCPFN